MCYKQILEEKCGELVRCSKLKEVLEECNDRVSSRTKTNETCFEELSDFIVCVDECVSIYRRRYIVSFIILIGCKESVSEAKVTDISSNCVVFKVTLLAII